MSHTTLSPEAFKKNKKLKLVVGGALLIAFVLIFLTIKPKQRELASLDAKGMILKTSHGDIELEFFPKDAPKTVTRIQELVASGFYDGLTFHNVYPGFTIETGDPRGDGGGGSGVSLPFEANSRKNILGTVGMTLLPERSNSADSQFYISLATNPKLDGKYTVFGQVTRGLDILEMIKRGDKITQVTLLKK